MNRVEFKNIDSLPRLLTDDLKAVVTAVDAVTLDYYQGDCETKTRENAAEIARSAEWRLDRGIQGNMSQKLVNTYWSKWYKRSAKEVVVKAVETALAINKISNENPDKEIWCEDAEFWRKQSSNLCER